jgi:hypothetical protein
MRTFSTKVLRKVKNLSGKVLLFLGSPIRYLIRHELRNELRSLSIALQNKATEATASYIEKYMENTDSVSTRLELLTKAMSQSTLKRNSLICEFGVYSGRSINHIASSTSLTVYGFDSFEGLPERWRDGLGKGTFKVKSLPKVRSNVTLVKGWFDKTLEEFIKENINNSLDFMHIDCDLYSSTKIVFDILEDRILPGCVIVFDEYFNYPGWESGEYKAFQEFIDRTGLNYEYIGYNRNGEQVAVKIIDG